MDRLVNTALTAMRGAMARQASIANNLANANTVGFRAEIAN
ncbi:MAG: flagellar biosynthesis protein FlgF, partial [Sphingobium sp.]